jgi:hypothetical protein
VGGQPWVSRGRRTVLKPAPQKVHGFLFSLHAEAKGVGGPVRRAWYGCGSNEALVP